MPDNGGLLGKFNFTTASTATGIWSEDDQYGAQKSSLWPPTFSVITTNLRLNLDASNSSSYSGSGTTWTDLTGNTNATLINSPTFNSSGVKSFTFNGTTQYATIPFASSPFRQSSAITYEAWVNVDSSGGGYVGGTSVSGGHGSGGFSVYDNNMYFVWTPSNPGSDRSFTNTTAVSFVNKWKHVCMTFNFTGNVKAMYIDGVSVAMTDSGSWTTATPNAAYNLSQVDNVGGRYVNSQGYFKGKIAELRIYNAALTAADVLNNYNATKNKYPVAPSSVDYLVVAGGGGSAGSYGATGSYGLGGGGGGAGGYLSGSALSVTAGTTYNITVGAGGVAGSTSQTEYRGGTGGNSVFSSITASGGGGGGVAAWGSRAPQTGGSGGSGGGGGANISPSNGLGGSGTSGQGNAGGDGGGTAFSSGGGGGGSSSSGSAGSSTNTTGGAGGSGTANSISGSSVTYAAGGTGGRSGGSEGAGTANTGNGAVGKNIPANSYDTTAFAGGSGVVIIRYADTFADASTTGSPTFTNAGGFKVYRFTGNGSITF